MKHRPANNRAALERPYMIRLSCKVCLRRVSANVKCARNDESLRIPIIVLMLPSMPILTCVRKAMSSVSPSHDVNINLIVKESLAITLPTVFAFSKQTIGRVKR